MSNPPSLITSGVIASQLQAPLHRVLRILATRPHIRPAAKAGNLRLYDGQSIELVRQELDDIEARRSARQLEHWPVDRTAKLP